MTSPATDAGDRADRFGSAGATSLRGLIAPVVLLMAVAVAALLVLLYAGASSLNRNAERTAMHLAQSMLETRRDALDGIARDHSWWDEAVEKLVEHPDQSWADDNIGSYQFETRRLSSSFVIAPDNATTFGYIAGKESDLDVYRYFGPGLKILVERARFDSSEQPKPAAGILLAKDGVHQVSVSPLTGEFYKPLPGSSPPRAVLVFAMPFDPAYLSDAGALFGLKDLRQISPLTAEPGRSLILSGPDGTNLTALAWTPERPGSDLAWQLFPALAAIAIAMVLLLVFFFRRADALVAHEASLISTLREERQQTAFRTDILAVLSHELRLPLSHIRCAMTNLDASDREAESSAHQREISDIRHALARIDRWVDNAMLLGRPDQGCAPVKRFDLMPLIHEAWDEARYLTDQSRPFLFAHDVDRADTLGDDFLLRACLVNILENAIKFSPQGEPVIVHLGERDGVWELAVRDHGPGVPEPELEAIFEPFRRGSNVGTVPGSGLGLAFAKSMVERTKGSIVSDNGVEGGAVFTIHLPKAEDRGAASLPI